MNENPYNIFTYVNRYSVLYSILSNKLGTVYPISFNHAALLCVLCFCAFYGGLSWVLTQNKVHGPCSQPVLLQSTAVEPHDHLEEDWGYFGRTAVSLAWFPVTLVAYTQPQWMSCSLFLFGTLSQLATTLCYRVESHPDKVTTIIQTNQVSMRSVTASMQ